MKVVFFGSSRFVVPILEMLLYSSDLSLVITTELGEQDPVPFFCKTKKIDFIQVKKKEDLMGNFQISQSMASLGIVADFGVIIPDEVFSMFTYGIINVHPSLLPKYRGPTPAQSAILNGDTKTGVSIIALDKQVDHGPIIEQFEEEILPTDTAKSLYERLFKLSVPVLQKIVANYDNNITKTTEQKHEDATFTKMLKKEDGYFDISKLESEPEFFQRMIRAYYPWPGVWTKVQLSTQQDEKIVKFLPEKIIQAEGKREVSYKDFINGYPNCDKRLLNFLSK